MPAESDLILPSATGRSLKVGIDGYNLAMPRGTGIATYGLNLARALHAGGHEVAGLFGLDVGKDETLRETMFFDAVDRPPTAKTQFGGRWQRRLWMALATANPRLRLRARNIPLSPFVDKDTFAGRLPRFDRLASVAGLFPLAHRHFMATGRFLTVYLSDPPDIMHWTYTLPIRVANSRNVYTIHDLVPLRLPYTTLGDKRYFRDVVSACVRNADHLCSISDYSRQDIIDQFKVSCDQITNLYQPVHTPEWINAEIESKSATIVRNVLGLDINEYYLYFGAIEPKKNIGRLIESYLSLGLQRPLILVGTRAWLADQELSLIELLSSSMKTTSSRQVILVDYVSRDLLARLIRCARAVLFPSLSEGFGLPILEAMQLGTPVLTSSRGAPAEIAGGAALLVDPYDLSGIAAGIKQLDDDADLLVRLSEAGRRRAKSFTMTVFLDRLEAMYARMLRR